MRYRCSSANWTLTVCGQHRASEGVKQIKLKRVGIGGFADLMAAVLGDKVQNI